MTDRSFRTEFPAFDPATMPAIPEGFADRSWENEPMPCFIHEASGLLLWIDYEDPSVRAWEESSRFTLQQLTCRDPEHGWQFTGDEVDLVETDDWHALVASIPNFMPKA